MLTLLMFLGCAAAVGLTGFYSGLETAIYSTSTVRLRALAARGAADAAAALRLLSDVPGLISALLVGGNLMNYLGTMLLTEWLAVRVGDFADICATAIFTPFCFLFGEMLPKHLAYAASLRYTLAACRVAVVSKYLFLPLSATLASFGNILRRLLRCCGLQPEAVHGRSALLEHFEAVAAAGFLTAEQHAMAHRIMALESLTVAEVMIPWPEVFCISASESCLQAAKRMINADHNRAPLVDASGKPTGDVVALSDMMRAAETPAQNAAQCGNPGLVLPPQATAEHALRQMRDKRAPLALVGDGGRILGIVTVADLLRQVLGVIKI